MQNATVGSELESLFPDGTIPVTSADNSARSGALLRPDIDTLPILPVDVFAAVAHLIETSGVHQYLVAPCSPSCANAKYDPPMFAPLYRDILDWIDIGRRWAVDFDVGANEVQVLWTELVLRRDDRLVQTPLEHAPDWWAFAHALLVIADEASASIGYLSLEEATGREDWANAAAAIALQEALNTDILPSSSDPTDEAHLSRHVSLDSLNSRMVSRDVARVLPKGRTTEIGCNIRTMSHNLALQPRHGATNAYWFQSQVETSDVSDLNILLVPFPYRIDDGCFYGNVCAEEPENLWGRFEIEQKWLSPGSDGVSTPRSRESFIRFVEMLLKKAAKKGGRVDVLVFPEYALDWQTYDSVVRYIRDNWPTVEFMISGTSEDCANRHGNQVVSTIFVKNQDTQRREAYTHSRRKHHRWCIDRRQIEMYHLEGDLAPNALWWEFLPVKERVLYIDVFRSGSTFTAVICEDLARVDPGLTRLRALGPNLVFALLMDGPQLKGRWPGIYATSLADDPGSSVLSLTSMGLVERSNRARKGARNVIALWKQRSGSPIELNLGKAHALLVRLDRSRAQEQTLEGRRNDDTIAWSFRDTSRLQLTERAIEANGWRWITR